MLAAPIFDELASDVQLSKMPDARHWNQTHLIGLGFSHFVLLFCGLHSFPHIDSLWGQSGLVLALGLHFGHISNTAAHELIHAPDRKSFKLGKWVYISLLIGHHTTAHRLIHHVHVGSNGDPGSASRGQSFYAFFPRAWWGGFQLGWQAETRQRVFRRLRIAHPYLVYLGGSAAFCIGIGFAFGSEALFAYAILCGHSQVQLFLADYVQHYGLRRVQKNERLEPVGPKHAWDAPHWFSTALLLGSTQHAAHHLPGRESSREISHTTPKLPYGLPVMATLALFPSLWFRVMHPRLDAFQNVERQHEAA